MAAKPGGFVARMVQIPKFQNFVKDLYRRKFFGASRRNGCKTRGLLLGGVVARDSSDHADGKVSASVVNMTLNDALSVDN